MFRLLLLAAFFASCVTSVYAGKPNILLILVDDLKPNLGCYGDPVAKTPNLDALAARGMRFDRAYCNQAVCAPSRFTLMLGSHSTSTGLYGLGSQLREIVPDAVTMPQFFARHGGYRTESLGKVFHIGHGNFGDPASFSVPHFADKVVEYVDPASTDGGKLTREEAYFSNRMLDRIKSLPRGAAWESPDVEDNAYADGRVAAETRNRLKAAKERLEKDGTPFFVAAGFARPHMPFSAPKKYWDLYDHDKLPMPQYEELPVGAPAVAGKRGGEVTNYEPVPEDRNAKFSDELKRDLIHGYYASTSFVDAQIGKVIDALDEFGLDDNTIVVLWGDHGFHLGDLGIWTKHTNYEQANRIPIFIVAPGVAEPGSFTEQPAESVDIYPTLAELAGLPKPDGPQLIDGVSLVPVLKDPLARVRDHAYHAYPKSKIGRAIRTERYRMVEWKAPGADPDTAEYELYDYEFDPLETKNLAADKPEILSDLRAILATYPEAVSRPEDKTAKASAGDIDGSPQIANRSIDIVVEVNSRREVPSGVVVAQGGRENGYAVYFRDGHAVFDVRIKGKVTSIESSVLAKGTIRVEASLKKKKMSIAVNGEKPPLIDSPGFIPAQPKDGLSVGLDTLSAAGNYESPNPFNGFVVSTRVVTGGKPPKVAKAMSRPDIEAGLKSHDRALFVKEGWIRDPFITRKPDGTYYLTGSMPNPGEPREKSDPYNTGLGDQSIVGSVARVWKSNDLIEWKSLGAPYSLKDGIWYSSNRAAFDKTSLKDWRLWAPELHWIPEKDRWALVHTSPSPVAGANLSLSAGEEVGGPWQNPMGTEIKRRHDPSLFQDDDGTWWLIWGATQIAPLKEDFSGFSGEPIEIKPSGDAAKMGHEGCLIKKVEGKYVLFGTGWSTGQMRRGSYNLYYATADKITGPYGERKFAGRFLGHGTPFQDGEGRWWCTAFYNANIPPVSAKGIESRDLGDTAQTINQQGLTLVPLDVHLQETGELYIRAKDPAYATPGPDEAQPFAGAKETKAGNPYVKTVPGRWSKEMANKWYAELSWLVGCNYYPATAINQIEMWQASTWDPNTIAKELDLAQSIGMNTLRVYLHDLVWADDKEDFYSRMDVFLSLCQDRGIQPSFVFFDDCHYPNPHLGAQPLPVAGWHNSGWVNCPARDVANRFAEGKASKEEVSRLKGYVQETLRRFDGDERVLYWELYNEPGRGNGENGDMGTVSMDEHKSASIGDRSNRLVYESWVWAREVAPSQPISSCTQGSLGKDNIAINQANADIFSVHSYAPPKKFEEAIVEAKKPGRPVIVTEWLARTNGNTVEECLPILKKHKVGAINWGFVMGKSGTIWPWSSRVDPETKAPLNLNTKRSAGEVVRPGESYPEPELWFHDLFRPDHTPYREDEIAIIRELTGSN